MTRPSRCAVDNASMSAASRAARRSTTREGCDEAPKAQLVAVGTEATEHRQRAACQGRPAALRLARVDVGEVHLDVADPHADQRIAQREARMAVRPGVDERAVGLAPHAVNRIDHRAFAVMLGEIELDAELRRHGPEVCFDVGERLTAVQMGLANSEKVEIRAVDNGDSHFRLSPSSQAVNCSRSPSGACDSSPSDASGEGSDAALVGVPSEKNWSNEYAPDLRGFFGAGSRNTWSSDSSPAPGR